MLNRNFGKLIDGVITYAPSEIRIGNTYYPAPTAEQYLAAGWKRIVDIRSPPSEGYTVVADGWDEQATEIIRIYRYDPIPLTVADYDAAMEEHIRKAREERGYTTREPSEYLSSSVPRWAQDAADFVRFRDAVMLAGLKVINEYAATGVAPLLAEFCEMLPKCEWTWRDEPEEA